jgi:DNA-binding beta-propeller fold protein YncE
MPTPTPCPPRTCRGNLLAHVITCLITICTLQSSVAIAADWLYWNDLQQTHAITRANLDGSGRQIVVPFLGGANNPAFMAVDPAGGKLYWANQGGAINTNNQIRRANLDGTGTEILYTPAVEAVGLDVDHQAGKLYWAEACCAIRRANLDGTGVETLYSTSHAFQFLALDVVHGTMYWSDFSSRQIFRASMSGTGAVPIVNGVDPRGIAVDPSGGKIYWTEAGTYQVMSANLDGSGAQTLVTGLLFPLGITLDLKHGTIYWADAYLRAILSANLYGANVTTVVSSSLIFPTDVAVVTTGGIVSARRSTWGALKSHYR